MKKKKVNKVKLEMAEDQYAWNVDVDGPAEALVSAIMDELSVELPDKEELKTPLPRKYYTDFVNHKIKLLMMLDNVVVIQGEEAHGHNREEIARWVSVNRETIRQCEQKAFKTLWKFNSELLAECMDGLKELCADERFQSVA